MSKCSSKGFHQAEALRAFCCFVLQTGRDLGNAGVPEHPLKWVWNGTGPAQPEQWEVSHPQVTLRCKLTGYLSPFHNTQATAWHSISTGGLKAPSLKRISATKPFADCFSDCPLSITSRDFRLGPVKLLLIYSDGNRGKFSRRVHRKLIGWTYRQRETFCMRLL